VGRSTTSPSTITTIKQNTHNPLSDSPAHFKQNKKNKQGRRRWPFFFCTIAGKSREESEQAPSSILYFFR
jgi:hypothetical protein